VTPSDLQPLEGLAQHPDGATPDGTLTLLSPGARWPDAMADLGEAASLQAVVEQAETWGDENAPPLLLGYTDPVRALHNLAAGDCEELDPLALLETWLSTTARFLEWKRQWPDQVRLLRLRPPAGAADAQSAADLDPRLLALLQALPQLAERHADLEGCADLEGEEPMFGLGLPPLRSGTFASLCLESWRQDRQTLELRDRERGALDSSLVDLRRQAAEQLEGMSNKIDEVRSALEATRTELDNTRSQLEATRGERDGLLSERNDWEQELLSLREAGAAAATGAEQRNQELEQTLQHTQAASEVTLAQLHAVQDTLEQLYGERRRIEDALQKFSAEREHLGNEAASLRHELEALQSEVAHYLRASTPGPQLDRSRIPRLTALLRDALHLH